MQHLGQWIVGLVVVMLLAGCGVEIVAPPPTPLTESPTPEEQAAASAVPTAPSTPTLVPTATIPPTTSPLPTFTPATSDTATVGVAPTIPQPTTLPDAPTTAPTPSQPTAAPTPDPNAAAILLIRERYTTINNEASGYRRVEQDLQGFSTEGGTLEAYYDGDTLRKMVATYFGEGGKAREEYYYWDDRLFFVFRADDFYDKPLGSVVNTTENRYYFADSRMIRWIDEAGQIVPPDEPMFATRQAQVTQQDSELRALLP